ncbi:unnamed protein product [Microthlaspi erraticum]|uniref:Uncharacterized protein n=1 Tax=Microthlaspi erraticum TaxID=1685480 RepID=A0A6D2L1W2_9BRAS|nr:unnamed protein product [Microthlaspi erraticum]
MSYFPPRSSSFCFFSRLVLPHPFLPVSFCLVGYNFGLVILSSFSSFLMVVVVGRWLLLVWDLVVTTGGSMLMLSLGVAPSAAPISVFGLLQVLEWLNCLIGDGYVQLLENGGQRSEAAAASLAARRGSRAAGLEFCVEVVRFCASPQRSCRCC